MAEDKNASAATNCYQPEPIGIESTQVLHHSCSGCGHIAGFVAWGNLYKAGWRKLRTDRSTYNLCPDCQS